MKTMTYRRFGLNVKTINAYDSLETSVANSVTSVILLVFERLDITGSIMQALKYHYSIIGSIMSKTPPYSRITMV